MRDPDQHPLREQPTPQGRFLGPHVVGQRVVIRRVLPGRTGPTGGPAMTDVLGVCLSWDGEQTAVQKADGEVVVIEIGEIVSGKPVPPRPSVRARVSAREVEEHVSVLWESTTTEPLGRWLLRSSPAHGGRLRRRGNSALAMDDPGIDWAEAAAGVRRFYAARDQVPTIQVRLDSEVEEALHPHGFAPLGDGDAHAQLASVARALRSAKAAAPDVAADLTKTPDSVVVDLAAGAATARGVLSNDWLLIDSVAVDPAHRRQGLATAALAEVLDWGASLGATTALLHVETVNAGAIALYEQHGFLTHHTNRYLHWIRS